MWMTEPVIPQIRGTVCDIPSIEGVVHLIRTVQ
jgi:hypothetical protein